MTLYLAISAFVFLLVSGQFWTLMKDGMVDTDEPHAWIALAIGILMGLSGLFFTLQQLQR